MSSASRIAITSLYVPGDRPDRVRKALSLDTDVVIVDLEDAVSPAGKDDARRAVRGLLEDPGPMQVQVRVNALDTPWAAEDLAMVAALPDAVEVRLPKVDSAETVARAQHALGSPRPMHCLLETPLAVEQAFEIGRSGQSVASLALGEQDLRSSLGVSDDASLDWSRGRVIVAAAAAGLPPPGQSVYTQIRDLDGLAAWCRRGRAMGFLGGVALHPAQLPVIRAAYRPSDEEVARARELLAEVDGAASTGSGVAVLSDGGFVDAAMVAGARRVLDVEAATRPGDR